MLQLVPSKAPAIVVLIACLAANAIAEEKPARFEADVKPFLQRHCQKCHNADEPTSGVRVDHLGADIEDRQIKLWESIRRQVAREAMPPEDETQPSAKERERLAEWVGKSLDVARSRPRPKNGGARRLTVAQYRNTLRELLQLEDEVTDTLPPDAVSKDGFLNNQDTLALSPLLVEAYLDIAEMALDRVIVDPKAVPEIQRVRMDIGTGINPKPCPDVLNIGANNVLLDNKDFVVTEPSPDRPFPFKHAKMRTKYRFIEGYDGNNTVRGWREFDSIYHSVFACLRGSVGYPKGFATNTVPEGLLLRPSITSDEVFEGDATYGPKSNFKISLRELPDHGIFRVTVTASRYRDGLLLDPGSSSGAVTSKSITVHDPKTSTKIKVETPGIYQVDIHPPSRETKPVALKADRLNDALATRWPLKGELLGDAVMVDSPLGKALSQVGYGDSLSVPRADSFKVGEGDFTVAAWINPEDLRQSGIVSLGKYGFEQGWVLDLPSSKGILRLETAGPGKKHNGSIQTRPETIRLNAWQHVAAVVRRGKASELFVNGEPVAQGKIGPANLDNPKLPLSVGRIQDSTPFRGKIADVRLYRRALEPAEIQAIVEPGRSLIPPPVNQAPQDVTLHLGDRLFAARWQQPAFVVVRLDRGEFPVLVKDTGPARIEKLVLTPLPDSSETARRFLAFEKRSPRLGVHVGLRRDCGSTLNQVGSAQTVSSEVPSKYVFQGAIRNFPSPEVEKDNVNYLAGIREIGVRSEITDGRDMPRLLIKSVEFEGPYDETWPPKPHKDIFFDSPAQKVGPVAYAREILTRFATRAFRRPVTTSEADSFLGVYEASAKSGSPFERAIKDALQVILTSPQFLFLIEASATPAAEPLDDYELASKLSYFLWNGPPDEWTLELASKGTLKKELDAEITRLMANPKFERFAREFGSQWLALEKFQVLEPDRKRFPKLTADTRAQLKEEPIQLLLHLLRDNRPIRELVEADYVVANEVVASYYGLGDRTESGFRFRTIPHGRQDLGGLLSEAAILAGLSDGRESNPIKRGAWLARRIVAEPPDDPPPNVPALKDDTKNLTLRQRLETHRSQRGCQQCHSTIDPWGIALEEFDAGGRFKTEVVDARSKLPDQAEVVGAKGLKKHLADDRPDQLAFSVLKHLATYATGRTLSQNELDSLKRDSGRFKNTGYKMQDLLRYVVQSPIFLEK